MNYKIYMRSSEWKEKRKAKLEACKSKCECEGGCVREATQVHHLHYDTLGNESMEDLQALCSKCHMSKSSKVRNFYGDRVQNCCLAKGQQEVEKTLPYHVWNEANFHLKVEAAKYNLISERLGAEPIIAALLDNLGIMFACGDISVTPKTTKAIGKYADTFKCKEGFTNDDGMTYTPCKDEKCMSCYFGGQEIYKIKPEFEKCFEISEGELETAREELEVA